MGSEHGNLLIMGKRFLILLALLLSALPPAFAGPRKIAKELEGIDPSKPVNVIVRFKRAPTANLHNKVLNRGGTLKDELGVIRSGVYSVPASALGGLAADPWVEYIAVNRPVRATRRNPGSWVNDYHAESVNAPAAWAQGLGGSGVGVAIIDSGIGDSPDLEKKQIVYSFDFVTGKAGNAVDQYGHGTHIAGIIAGNGKSSTGADYFYRFLGIAGGVNLIDLRVLDENGEGTDANVIAAIQKAITLKDKYNIRVINLSLGRDVFEGYALDPLCQAVEEAWKTYPRAGRRWIQMVCCRACPILRSIGSRACRSLLGSPSTTSSSWPVGSMR